MQCRYTRGKNPNSRNGFKKGYIPSNKGTTGMFLHSTATRKKIGTLKIGNKNNVGKHWKIASEKRKNMARKREENGNWKGGSIELNNSIRALSNYKSWREHVFQRDNYTCQDCGIRSGCGETVVLHADHIVPFSFILQTSNIKSTDDAYSCDFLWDIRNGKTLCVPCHKKTPTFAGKMVKYYSNNK